MGNRPGSCTHEDWPCCGCGEEPSQEEQHEQSLESQEFEMERDLNGDDEEHEDNFTDSEADADTLRSAGMGTDEDYGGGHDIDTPMGDYYEGE